MALTGNSKGSLHPGGNPKSIYGYAATFGTEIYRCPEGRMAYLTDCYKGIRINSDRQQTGASDTTYKEVYVTAGDVVYTLSNGSKFFGIEFDI